MAAIAPAWIETRAPQITRLRMSRPNSSVPIRFFAFGGSRSIQSLLPVLRELGLVCIFWDVNFSSVQEVFDDKGNLKDPSFVRRIDKFLAELIWMAKTLRHGREHIALE